MPKQKDNWETTAVKHPGALTAKAKRAGKTIPQYCAQGNLSGTSKKQCNLAKTFRKQAKSK